MSSLSPSYLDPLSAEFVIATKACIRILRRHKIFGRPLQECSDDATELLVQLKYVQDSYKEMCEAFGKYIIAILFLMGRECAKEICDERRLSQSKLDDVKELQTIMKGVLKLATKLSLKGGGSGPDQSSVERELQRFRNRIQDLPEENQEIDVDSLVNRVPGADGWRALATFSKENSEAIREAIAPLGAAFSTGSSSPESVYSSASTSSSSSDWDGPETPQFVNQANREVESDSTDKIENSYENGDSPRVPITQTNEGIKTSGGVSNRIVVNSRNGSNSRDAHRTGSADFDSSRSGGGARPDQAGFLSSARGSNLSPSQDRSPVALLEAPPSYKVDPKRAQEFASVTAAMLR